MPEWRDILTELDSSPMDSTPFKIKATEHFADTLAEFCNELSGAELFECFLAAAYNNAELVKKEYDKAQELVDLLRCK
jgi:hypothetical protein